MRYLQYLVRGFLYYYYFSKQDPRLFLVVVVLGVETMSLFQCA